MLTFVLGGDLLALRQEVGVATGQHAR